MGFVFGIVRSGDSCASGYSFAISKELKRIQIQNSFLSFRYSGEIWEVFLPIHHLVTIVMRTERDSNSQILQLLP